ncbi:uncharacterized protein [Montipora foliosa]|uniref:uncharacterized protein isoform X2 n=1 Tax=Montipora foliosa TaxID=591990 RepID=UPI0035F1F6F9
MKMQTVRQKPWSVMSIILVVAFIIITPYSGCAASSCSTYKVFKANTIWKAAQTKCGGDLVAMESEEEWNFWKSKVNESTFQNKYGQRWHIGLRKRSDKWCWTTRNDTCMEVKVGTPRWNKGEPNNLKTEACVEMLISGSYNNIDCSKNDVDIGYICERKIATTKPTTKMITNPKKQLTTEKSHDVGTTSKVPHVSSSLQSEKHETNVFNPTKGAKDTASPVLKYIIESNQKKKNKWVTIVTISVPAAMLIVLLILLGCIIKRRMVSKKSDGCSAEAKDKNTSRTEDKFPATSPWSKEHVYDNMLPPGDSSKMLSEQDNKTGDQKYLYATVDKTRKKKAKSGVHFKPVSGDLVYAELDFNPSSQDAFGAAAEETPTKVTATVYASIEETCG